MYRTDAARFLNVSLSTIKRFEKEGILIPTKNKDGENYFDMPQLEALRAERNGQAAPETEAMIATLDNAASHSASSQKHVERLMNLVLDPANEALRFLKELLADVRAECDKLRSENFALLTKMADLLKAQRQEDIEQERVKLSDERKQQALGLVKSVVPMLIAQASGNKQIGNLLSFVQSLGADQLAVLRGSGLLSQEQVQALDMILTEDQRTALAQQVNSSAEETPEESSPA